jgi:hypothetical protein
MIFNNSGAFMPREGGRRSRFCDAAKLAGRPLLTGNGIPHGFSVLVQLAYKMFGAGFVAFRNKMRGRKHA